MNANSKQEDDDTNIYQTSTQLNSVSRNFKNMIGSGRNSSAFVDTTMGTIIPREISSALDQPRPPAQEQQLHSLRRKENSLERATAQVMQPLRQKELQPMLSRDELALIDKKYLKRIEEQIEETYRQRLQAVRDACQDAKDASTLHYEEQLQMSKQISHYRLKRLEQQKQLQRVIDAENRERQEMDTRFMIERQAYEETKFQLQALQKRVRRLKRKNARDRRTEDKINFLINQDFTKWTNSFSRKSVLWDNKKKALMTCQVRVPPRHEK